MLKKSRVCQDVAARLAATVPYCPECSSKSQVWLTMTDAVFDCVRCGLFVDQEHNSPLYTGDFEEVTGQDADELIQAVA